MEVPKQPEHRPASGMVHVWRPDTLEEALRLKRQYGEYASYVAGGTWLRTRWESGNSELLPHLISLDRIAQLKTIQQLETGSGADCVRIGASVTLSAVEEHPELQRAVPLLVTAARSIAAPSVRRQATIGGNVMTRSGDMIPALLALDAVIVLFSNGRGRYERLPIAEWLAGGGDDREKLAVGFEIGHPAYRSGWYRKIGRREAFSPSVITVACTYRTDAAAGALTDVRLAVGGSGMVPVRLYEAETVSEEGGSGACVYGAVRRGVPSASDDYAGAAYRRMAAANIIAAELDRVYGVLKEGLANGEAGR